MDLLSTNSDMRFLQEIPDFRKLMQWTFTNSSIFMQFWDNFWKFQEFLTISGNFVTFQSHVWLIDRHEITLGNSWFQEIYAVHFHKFFNFHAVLRQFLKISGIFNHFRKFCRVPVSCLYVYTMFFRYPKWVLDIPSSNILRFTFQLLVCKT